MKRSTLLRFISAFFGIIILFWVMASGRFALNVAMAIISFMALLEMYKAMDLYKHVLIIILSILAAFGFTFGELSGGNSYLSEIVHLYIFLSFIYFVLYRNKIKISDLASVFFVTFFICYFFANVVYVRHLDYGKYLVWIIFISSWITDSGAYFTGRFCGKHKLIQNISPNKTVEGAVGGLILCVAANLMYGLILQHYYKFQINFISLLIVALILSIVAQFGDLSMSAIKRDLRIKDFSNIMPGHGGVLDRFDSVLFVAPVAYTIMQQISIIWS